MGSVSKLFTRRKVNIEPAKHSGSFDFRLFRILTHMCQLEKKWR